MTQDEIINIARKAGLNIEFRSEDSEVIAWFPIPYKWEALTRFISIFESRLIASGYRKCAAGQDTTQFCGLVEAAVKAEREACSKECDKIERRYKRNEMPVEIGMKGIGAKECADAIRARGTA